MISRRRFTQAAALFSGGAFMVNAYAKRPEGRWQMPDESAPHTRTWMAFGASEPIWGSDLLPAVQQNLADIALTIAEFEPVSMLVRKHDYARARELMGDAVELVVAPLDDLWIRDTGPTFILNGKGQKAAVDLNFNGWGEKQAYSRDARVSGFVARQAGAQVINTDLVLEGGCIEVDGEGTAIITESCVLNDNRNPDVSKAAFETELKQLLGLDKIIWLPGIRGKDITDGHTDFYARFVRPGVVIAGYEPYPDTYDHQVTKRHLEILRSATDAQGRKLDVLVLEAPEDMRQTYFHDEFASGYVGFYLCNGGVIAQQFGDAKADRAAKQVLQRAFPDREVVQLKVDALAAGGGSIHCATQQEPVG